MVEYPHNTIRAVTHYGVDATDVERVLAACAAALRETSPVEVAAATTAPAPATSQLTVQHPQRKTCQS